MIAPAPEEHVLERPNLDKVRILVSGDPKALVVLFEAIRERYGRYERVESISSFITKYRYLIDGFEHEFLDVSRLCVSQPNGDWTKYLKYRDAALFVADLPNDDEYGPDKAKSVTKHARKNRMKRALESWERLCDSKEANDISKILVLNQKDLFAKQILSSGIQDQEPSKAFAEIPTDYEQRVRYFVKKFADLDDCCCSDLFIRVTTPQDTNKMKFLQDSIRTIVTTNN